MDLMTDYKDFSRNYLLVGSLACVIGLLTSGLGMLAVIVGVICFIHAIYGQIYFVGQRLEKETLEIRKRLVKMEQKIDALSNNEPPTEETSGE